MYRIFTQKFYCSPWIIFFKTHTDTHTIFRGSGVGHLPSVSNTEAILLPFSNMHTASQSEKSEWVPQLNAPYKICVSYVNQKFSYA